MTEQDHAPCTCKQLAEKLLLYRDGQLDPEQTEQLRQHLGRCPTCMDLIQSYDELVEVLQRLHPVEVPEDLCARLKGKLRERG